ncbi:MAG: hypothetical protein ABSE47_06250 [Acidimicrobiales bacterium]|jgi:hypothetical protein
MPDETRGTTDAKRVLDAHLAGMAAAAATLEQMLGNWAQQWCRDAVEGAAASDVHRTDILRAAHTYEQMTDAAEQIAAELPDRIAAGLRASAWRHLYVNVERAGTGSIMGDLDYGTWQETGHKMPPAYEPVIAKELGRMTQLLRKYGYRPELTPVGARRRYSAPPEAISTMEAYYRLAMRLPEVVTAAERASRQAARDRMGSWDA